MDQQLKNQEPDLEIADVENYRSDKFQVFSHQALVMEVMRRCLESASHELREGFINEKSDKFGNVSKTYIESTREKFISSLESCEMAMACDLDKEAINNIKALKQKLVKKKVYLLDQQWKWYSDLKGKDKQSVMMLKTELTNQQIFYFYLESYKVKIYKEIFKELTKLTKRLDWYQQEEFIG